MTWMTNAGWKKYFGWVFIAFLAVCLGMTSEALASEDARMKVLTLDEALRITLQKNKDIQKAREYRNMVEGRYIEERAAVLPQLQMTALVSRDRDESLATFFRGLVPVEKETRSGEIALTQALYTFGRIGAAIRAAKIGLATAEDQLRLFRQAAFRDVSASFFDILLAKELHSLAAQILEQRTRHLDEARKKFVAGVATEYDVLAAEVAVENARPDVIRAENLIRTSRERLRFLLGIAEQVDVVGSLEGPLGLQPQYGDTVEIAWKNRPELSDLRKRLGVAKELVKIYDAGNLPRLDLKAAYGWRQLVFGSTAGDGQEWSAGLYLTFPFFDGLRTQGKVIQAKTEVANLKLDEAKQIDTISLQARDAVNAFQESTQIVRALAGTVKQAERLLSMAEKGYEFVVKTKLDVDDAQLNLTQAKGNLARARRDYLVANVTLEWVKGTLEVSQNL
jgi:outer membrane protein TolC